MAEDETEEYLSVTDAAALLNVERATLSKYKLPKPDATIGLTGRKIRGWKWETIVEWNRNRPGQGRRPKP